jgi:hypothetical protein
MASIMIASLDVTKIDKSKIEKGKYYPITITINNEVGKFGDSGYIAEGQTKEERDAKAPKNFLGNPKVVWTDGENVAVPPRDDAPALETATVDDDLPF